MAWREHASRVTFIISLALIWWLLGINGLAGAGWLILAGIASRHITGLEPLQRQEPPQQDR